MSTVLAIIPARGGSKSIPRKNIKPLGGKPLIAWTIDAALQSQVLSRVIVSTDDAEIAQTGRDWGAEAPFLRPPELAQHDSSSVSVVLHALQWLEEQERFSPDYVLLLQPTSPFRNAEDIRAAIALAETQQAGAVVSVSEAEDHPYLCKRVLSDGMLADFVKSDLAYLRRQDLPTAYALNGAIYLCLRESFVRDRVFLAERTLAYIMPTERSLDIDTPLDWRVAELVSKDHHEHV